MIILALPLPMVRLRFWVKEMKGIVMFPLSHLRTYALIMRALVQNSGQNAPLCRLRSQAQMAKHLLLNSCVKYGKKQHGARQLLAR